MKRTLFLFTLIQFVLLSCATVTFNVDHPPLVDLRGVNSITVVPLEWNSGREDGYLASRVTYALLSGIRKGNINIVDPYSLEYTYTQNYSRYADVYISGRITGLRAFDSVQRREDKTWSETRIITRTTRTVYVDIEYAYYRSANNQVLGRFEKTASGSQFVEHTRRASERQNGQGVPQGAPQGVPRQERGSVRRSAPRNSARIIQQRDGWTNSIAAFAVLEFADTMDNELGPWATMERRSIRGSASGDPLAAEAKKLVRQGQYNLALDKFTAVYEKTGSVFAGYNTAILLAANNRFTEALALLQKIDRTITEAGKRSPSFIKSEITKMTGYIDGFKILGRGHASPSLTATSAAAGASVPEERPSARVTFRTVNVTDEGGRLLTQTTYTNRDEAVSVTRYTWQGERITSVTVTEGPNVKKTEYEYNVSGGRTAQRDYNNGVLERQILTQGNREIEELYLNGRIVLRAVWENGLKISEERIPAR
jgi:hypothetical protein